jgi:hypothetical protein
LLNMLTILYALFYVYSIQSFDLPHEECRLLRCYAVCLL